jgi:uncharacterized protein YbaR (Trm112 family)
MLITITCKCNAKFEIKDGIPHRSDQVFACPNCGSSLPSGASESILSMMESYSDLYANLMDEDERYDIGIYE